ncbi:MAG TPA: HAMP domain-containing sensor histidine kinase [Burkholderiales bacterium]|nr:HAMP domain-containing sensor histidine kinase [Burkholderiales bacterium]
MSTEAAPTTTYTGEFAVPADHAPAADPTRQILADRVEQLYRQSVPGTLLTLFVGAIITVELWTSFYRDLTVIWWLITIAISAARYGLYRAYLERVDHDEKKWLRWMAIGALAAGVNWGIASAVIFPSHTDNQQVFLAFILAGLISGGIALFASVWWTYAIYAVGIILPFTYVLANSGSRMFVELALLMPVFYLANVVVAYRLDHVFTSGFKAREDYRGVAQEQKVMTAQIEEQLQELLNARREVEASGRKLSLFAERAPIAVLEFDANATVLEMNPAAENLFGYALGELVGRNALQMLFPADELGINESWWRDFLSGVEPATFSRLRCLRRDGLDIMCEFTLTPLVNDEDDVISVIAQGRDITQQIEAERLKKEFTSTLSHELRTPLTSIIGSLQLINSGVLGDVEKDVSELTTIAERNGQRLLDLINDLLDIEKIESGKFTLAPEVVSIDSLLRDTLVLNKGFADRYHVQLVIGKDLAPAKVEADPKRLVQVVTNLLSNAAKFSPEGGAVDVTLKLDGDRVRVGVHDRGPGIPDAFRSRIFSRFAQADSTATRQKGGTGLGLAICKRLIELMHGSIGFEDRPGGGSTFYFELPVLGDKAVSNLEQLGAAQ